MSIEDGPVTTEASPGAGSDPPTSASSPTGERTRGQHPIRSRPGSTPPGPVYLANFGAGQERRLARARIPRGRGAPGTERVISRPPLGMGYRL